MARENAVIVKALVRQAFVSAQHVKGKMDQTRSHARVDWNDWMIIFLPMALILPSNPMSMPIYIR